MNDIANVDVKKALAQLLAIDAQQASDTETIRASLQHISVSLERIDATVSSMRAYEHALNSTTQSTTATATTAFNPIMQDAANVDAARTLAAAASGLSEEIVELLRCIYTGRDGSEAMTSSADAAAAAATRRLDHRAHSAMRSGNNSALSSRDASQQPASREASPPQAQAQSQSQPQPVEVVVGETSDDAVQPCASEFFVPSSPRRRSVVVLERPPDSPPVAVRHFGTSTDFRVVSVSVETQTDEEVQQRSDAPVAPPSPLGPLRSVGSGFLSASAAAAAALASEECAAIVRLSQANELLKRQVAFQRRFIAEIRAQTALSDADADAIARRVSDEGFIALNAQELATATESDSNVNANASLDTSTASGSLPAAAAGAATPRPMHFCGAELNAADLSVTRIRVAERGKYIRVGDVVTSVNGVSVASAAELVAAVSALPAQLEAITVGLTRAGVATVVKVLLVAPPSGPAVHPLLASPSLGAAGGGSPRKAATPSSPLLGPAAPGAVTFAKPHSGQDEKSFTRSNTYTGQPR